MSLPNKRPKRASTTSANRACQARQEANSARPAMTRKMIWAVGCNIVFQNHRDYLAAADVLCAHGYEVVWRPDIVDSFSGAYCDAYKLIAEDQLLAMYKELDRLIDPFDGLCPERICWSVKPHVAFAAEVRSRNERQ